jgi:hypothetical protein
MPADRADGERAAAHLSASAEWLQAVEWHQQIVAWACAQLGRGGPPVAWLQQRGIPCSPTAPGRLATRRHGGHEWLSVRLQRPSSWGEYVHRCRQCGELALVRRVLQGSGLCTTCRWAQLNVLRARRQQQRAGSRRQRSLQLAGRRGLCLVCRREMVVARVTRITCGDRCRKRWLRNGGAAAFPMPVGPPHLAPLRSSAPAIFLWACLQQAEPTAGK